MIAFYVIGIYPCSNGGMEIFDYYLSKEISKDEKIIIITDCSKIKKNNNIKIIPVSSRLFLIRRFGLGKISLILSSFIQIYRHRKEIDVIHVTAASNSGYYGSVFPVIKKITGIPYIVSFHGGGLFPWSKHSFFYNLFKNANRSIAVSPVIKETLEKRTEIKFDLILPLVPFSKTIKSKQELRNDYGVNENARILLMVGSIKPLKGSRFVVESIGELGNKYLKDNKIILILAGDGEDKNAITDIIKKRGFSDFVKLIGCIPNERIHELFALADIYIIASQFEGTSISLLEAMYNKLPIIASNVFGINNIINDGHNGFLFEYNNKLNLLSKLKEAIENKKLSENLGYMAQEFYKTNYSFANTVNSFRDVFEQVRIIKSSQIIT